MAACLFLAFSGSGCTYFRNMGSGAHLDQPRVRPHAVDNRVRTMQVEVTTDAQGQVADIVFKRSSGKEGIDGYVADTIRHGWPAQPSTRTLAEITYSSDKGFSRPQVLSTTPVP